MKRYCTYLTIYRGNTLPPFYIGSTSIERISNGYRGSVESREYKKLWKYEIKNNPHLFKTVIISTHYTRKEAACKEEFFHKSLNVVPNQLYVNKAFFNTKSNHLVYIPSDETKRKWSEAKLGKKQTEEHIRNKVKSRSGYTHSDQTKSKMSMASLGKPKSESHKNAMRNKFVSNDTKLKISQSLKGKPKSEQAKEKLRGRKQSDFTKNKRADTISKHWQIITPENILIDIKNLSAWCREVGFIDPNYASSRLRIKGEYQGYILIK